MPPCLVALATLFLPPATLTAQQASLPTGPYCGIYTLYTALKVQNVDVDFAQLLKPQYVGSHSGSTMPELLAAAQQNGMHAEMLSGLGTADLRNLKCPAILHVKTEYDSPEYNHYILCVPMPDGDLAFYDPPNPMTHGSGHELAALWDGTALAVSGAPVPVRNVRIWAAVRIATICAAVIGIAILFIAIRSRLAAPLAGRCSVTLQLAVLLASGCIIAGSYQLLAPEGFAAQKDAVSAIRSAHFVQPPRWVELAEARELFEQGVQFIDARNTADYFQGHIEGAISIPPNASRIDRLRALSNLPADVQLVVYCQSTECPLAALLAKRIARDGFTNVSVFAGGWTAWNPTAAQTVSAAN